MGSSGSSRRLSNIVLPIENASIDHYAKELLAIVDGENDELHQYYKLSTKIKYDRVHYDSTKKEYKLYKPINPSATAEEASVPSVSGGFAPTSAENPSEAAEGQITPPIVDTEVSSNVAESEIYSLDFAQELVALLTKYGKQIPNDINDVVNPKDLDAKLHDLLQRILETELNPSV